MGLICMKIFKEKNGLECQKIMINLSCIFNFFNHICLLLCAFSMDLMVFRLIGVVRRELCHHEIQFVNPD